ncbi:MAG: hypothetical protein ABFS18_02020 [Thermodesulfobacteriota bacterium]
MASKEHDKWLAANTFECKRLNARITKTVCAEYQAENQDRTLRIGLVASARTIRLPGCCQGCPQAPAGDATIKRRACFGWRKRRKTRQKAGRM